MRRDYNDIKQPAIDARQFKLLTDNLQNVAGKIEQKKFNAILEGGCEIFATAAQLNLYNNGSVMMGGLVDSVGIIRRRKGRWNPYLMVGPRYYKPHRGSWAHIVEYGSQERFSHVGLRGMRLQSRLVKERLSSGKVSRGAVKPKPFMKPAFNDKKVEVMNFLRNKVAELLEETIRKQGFDFK